ncbi:Major facilitator Superfamily [Phytophthora nicotianae]|uniref:Major facilitator Superfamily n=1 Tax=Phytophthora nicotianae TaxID=4792 RepID=A0A0W8D6K5_PHYNI|nr:Major facilitator Superfamily [Phytophthora nicotianae]
MLDLLSPLRGYIAQNLQFYLSKYIEDIQLEGLGLFGGDLVLNDLEIKRHVLRESLEIPSSFDFSRGFIRELRIHIPWTQLLSQPIEVKLYTIELILTGKNRSARAASVDTAVDREPEIEQPKSGWINDTLQRILANISVQVNNLVLKYENDDVVFSIALGSASRKIDQAHELSSQTRNRDYVQNGGVKDDPTAVPTIPAVVSQKDILKVDTASKKQESWFGWAMNALGAAEDGKRMS